MNALMIINKRAKQLRSKNKSLSHIQAVKKASAEYRSGSLGKVKRPKQTGTSNTKRDKQRKAKPPGKRRAKSGKVYSERRKNRSDAPGKITGVPITAQLGNELQHVRNAEAKVWQIRNTKKAGKTTMEKNELKRQLKYWQKAKLMHKKNLTNLKRLI